MDAVLLVVVPLVGYLIAYHTYGRFLARKVFKLDPNARVPSRELEDGVDFVPTRKGIIFGHHYTSIAGTGPIVGPAIGIIWGWVPALIWVFVGCIVMGAVHDLGSLVVSLRNQGKSMSEIAARYMNRRVRTIFFLVVFLGLLIVIAIFGLVIAVLFDQYPEAVLPIWLQIPIAVALGVIVYRRGGNVILFTAVAVVAMYLTMVAGHFLPVVMPDLGAVPATGVWSIILLIYAYVASTLPVTVLLQPRDYINAWQLFVAMGLLVLGVLCSGIGAGLHIVAPALNLSPEGAPPLWPFLFVTIACGAISGFHSLVASGTTAKQVETEDDAQFVGYGSMLMEGVLAVLVIVSVAAGIGMMVDAGDAGVLTGRPAWDHYYRAWTGTEGLATKIRPMVDGAANMIGTIGIPRSLGMVIIGVFIASFAGTTLDTATRIQRYVICELASDMRFTPLTNRWTATALAVVSAGALAFATGANGAGAMALWPMFGSVNQLLAALALLIVTLYLKRKGGTYYVLTGLPCLFMLAMTIWAMTFNELKFVGEQKWTLASVNAITLLLALWMVVEGVLVFSKTQPGVASDASAQPTV